YKSHQNSPSCSTNSPTHSNPAHDTLQSNDEAQKHAPESKDGFDLEYPAERKTMNLSPFHENHYKYLASMNGTSQVSLCSQGAVMAYNLCLNQTNNDLSDHLAKLLNAHGDLDQKSYSYQHAYSPNVQIDLIHP